MNFPGVAAGDPKMLAEIAATQNAGKTRWRTLCFPQFRVLNLPLMWRAALLTIMKEPVRQMRLHGFDKECGP